MKKYTIRIEKVLSINADNDQEALLLATEAVEDGLEYEIQIIEKETEEGNWETIY